MNKHTIMPTCSIIRGISLPVMFKISVTFFLPVLFLVTGCSKEPKVRIEIRMENAEKSMSYLVELSNIREKIIDSAKFKRNGKANYSFPIKVPGYYQLKFENNQSLTLILSPNEEVKLTADYNNIYKSKNIEGSDNTIRVNFLQDSLRSTILKLNHLKDEYAQLKETSSDIEQMNKLSGEYDIILEGYKRFSIGFILDDLKSLANIAAVFQEYSPGYYLFSNAKDLQFYKLVSDTLAKYYPDVKYVKVLTENYKTMFDNYQAQRLMQMTKSVDNSLPDIQLPDKKGTIVKLSSLRGKIVLLSFWSMLDENCVELNRDMISIYKKYRGNEFEIFQVSIDDSRNEWLKAIKFDEIPWISVSDTAYPNSNIAWAYNLSSIPLNYLISKDQTEILGKNLTSSNLELQLKQLLNK